MKRMVLVSLFAALLATRGVQAQVAVTELVPAAPRYLAPGLAAFNSATLTADNPAAVQWEKTPHAAYGLIRLSRETPGSATPKDDFSGYFVGYRGAMDGWALGLEQLSVEQDTNGVASETAQSAHASLKVADILAVGAGLDRNTTDFGGFSETVEGLTFGASLNLKKVFYVGYASGSETFEDSNGFSAKRDTTLLGFAVRTEGSWRWHLGYDKLEKEDFGNFFFRGFDATTYTVQLGAGDLVGGVQQVTIEPRLSNRLFKATVVDIGWAPKRKLFLTVRVTSGEETTDGVVTEKDTSNALVVGYSF